MSDINLELLLPQLSNGIATNVINLDDQESEVKFKEALLALLSDKETEITEKDLISLFQENEVLPLEDKGEQEIAEKAEILAGFLSYINNLNKNEAIQSLDQDAINFEQVLQPSIDGRDDLLLSQQQNLLGKITDTNISKINTQVTDANTLRNQHFSQLTIVQKEMALDPAQRVTLESEIITDPVEVETTLSIQKDGEPGTYLQVKETKNQEPTARYAETESLKNIYNLEHEAVYRSQQLADLNKISIHHMQVAETSDKDKLASDVQIVSEVEPELKEKLNLDINLKDLKRKISDPQFDITTAKLNTLELSAFTEAVHKEVPKLDLNKLSLFANTDNTPDKQGLVSESTLKITHKISDMQWGSGLGEKVLWMVKDGIKQAKIQVTPAELGPIDVKLNMDKDQATVVFSAAHQLTRETLEQAIPKLRDMMQQQGIHLLNVDVSSQQGGGNAYQMGGNRQSQHDVYQQSSVKTIPVFLGNNESSNISRKTVGIIDTFA